MSNIRTSRILRESYRRETGSSKRVRVIFIRFELYEVIVYIEDTRADLTGVLEYLSEAQIK